MDNRQQRSCNSTVGRILNIDRANRSFTTMSDGNVNTLIRFNVSPDTQIFDLFGHPINFNGLSPGMRVRVCHASFMTRSIPPQTTAFVIQIVR